MKLTDDLVLMADNYDVGELESTNPYSGLWRAFGGPGQAISRPYRRRHDVHGLGQFEFQSGSGVTVRLQFQWMVSDFQRRDADRIVSRLDWHTVLFDVYLGGTRMLSDIADTTQISNPKLRDEVERAITDLRRASEKNRAAAESLTSRKIDDLMG